MAEPLELCPRCGHVTHTAAAACTTCALLRRLTCWCYRPALGNRQHRDKTQHIARRYAGTHPP